MSMVYFSLRNVCKKDVIMASSWRGRGVIMASSWRRHGVVMASSSQQKLRFHCFLAIDVKVE